MLPSRVTTALALLVSVAWAANVIVGFVSPDRHDPAINGIFAIVTGAVFALGRRSSRRGNDEPPTEPESTGRHHKPDDDA